MRQLLLSFTQTESIFDCILLPLLLLQIQVQYICLVPHIQSAKGTCCWWEHRAVVQMQAQSPHTAKQSSSVFVPLAAPSPHPAPSLRVCVCVSLTQDVCVSCLIHVNVPYTVCVVIDYPCSSDCPISKCRYDSF